MRNYLLATAAALCIAACTGHTGRNYPTSENVNDSITALEYARILGLGWNLGNQFDSFKDGVSAETAWGNPAVTPAIFDSVAAAGFSHVRIPVTWLGHVGPAPDYRIDSAWLNRVAETVGYAENAGLHVIINIHHDGADSANWLNIKNAATDSVKNAEINARLAAMWRQIASRFADKGDFLMFEAVNEIHDGGWGWGENTRDGGRQYSVHNGWMQTFVDAVRATGGNNATRFLGIPGYCTNPKLTMEHLVLPTDCVPDRLLVAVHFYDPVGFTINGKKTEWGHSADSSHKESWGDEQNVTDIFDALKKQFIDKGVPVYIGEFGCGNRGEERAEAFRRYYLEYVCKAAADRSIALTYWDNGYNRTGHEAFGLFDRTNGKFYNADGRAAVLAMTRAYNTTDSAYTLSSIYDRAPFASATKQAQ